MYLFRLLLKIKENFEITGKVKDKKDFSSRIKKNYLLMFAWKL